MPSYRYPLLNDRDWLTQSYLIEERSLPEIANMVGAKNHNSVRQALQRFNITIRNISQGLTAGREDDGLKFEKSVMDGCLLGDGFMRCHNPSSSCSYPYFKKKNLYRDHIEYVANLIFANTTNNRITWEETMGGASEIYNLRSLSHAWLKPYYDQWYPANNNRKKIIPRSISVDPVVLLHWFMDDGYSYKRNRNTEKLSIENGWHQRTKQVCIGFCSESFSQEDQQWLCDAFNEQFDLGLKVAAYRNGGTGWRIHIPQSKAQHFFKVIGPCPVQSLAYKWK